jgi:hypothetical protein
MAIRRIRIDYTVYPPDHQRGEACWDFRTFRRAKTAARRLGSGSRIYRNFNQTNKRGAVLGDWWSGEYLWSWNGNHFRREFDSNRFRGSNDEH